MYKGFALSIALLLLLSSATLADINQAQGFNSLYRLQLPPAYMVITAFHKTPLLQAIKHSLLCRVTSHWGYKTRISVRCFRRIRFPMVLLVPRLPYKTSSGQVGRLLPRRMESVLIS